MKTLKMGFDAISNDVKEIEIGDKVVIIADGIYDNGVYIVSNFAPLLNNTFNTGQNKILYILEQEYTTRKFALFDSEIRLATEDEILNNIKLDEIILNTIVVNRDLLEPKNLMEIIKFNTNTLECVAIDNSTKEIFNFLVTKVRSTREIEKKIGHRIPVYNKDMYMSYLNPFMVYDLYNINVSGYNMRYKNYLTKLEILYLKDDNILTTNGERLYNDIDFNKLHEDMYDIETIGEMTNYVATDKDGTTREFKCSPNIKPILNEILGVWFVIEDENNFLISINKVKGMLSNEDYINSLRYVGHNKI